MKAATPDYPLVILWSEEDEAYLVRVPDLPGCMADGPTQEAALANARVVIQEWIETANEEGRGIPVPLDNRRFVLNMEESAVQQHAMFEQAVQEVAGELVKEMLPEIVAKVTQRLSEESEAHPSHGNIFFGGSRKVAFANA